LKTSVCAFAKFKRKAIGARTKRTSRLISVNLMRLDFIY
jgi:hypothetical protein